MEPEEPGKVPSTLEDDCCQKNEGWSQTSKFPGKKTSMIVDKKNKITGNIISGSPDPVVSPGPLVHWSLDPLDPLVLYPHW